MIVWVHKMLSVVHKVQYDKALMVVKQGMMSVTLSGTFWNLPKSSLQTIKMSKPKFCLKSATDNMNS